jgi:hypothetical protein
MLLYNFFLDSQSGTPIEKYLDSIIYRTLDALMEININDRTDKICDSDLKHKIFFDPVYFC